jgi:peptide/nickel transport system substrate-binding protein
MKNARVAPFVVGVTLAILAAGCSSSGKKASPSNPSPGSATSASSAAGQPRRGGTLTVAVFSEVRGVDPLTTNGSGNTGGNELGAIYDRLIEWNPVTRTYDPKVAESVTANADSTVWTIKLRPGIKFQSGDPLTSDAVKFSIDRQKTGGNIKGLLTSVKSVDVVDPLTTQITLISSWPAFRALLSGSAGMIVDPAVVNRLGSNFASAPVGAGVGPYMFKSFNTGEALELTKNPNYWGGEPYLDELKFVPVSGPDQALGFLKSGAVQMAVLRDPQVEAQAKAAGLDGYDSPVSLGEMLLINNGLGLTCSNGQPAQYCAGKPDGTKVRSTPPGADLLVRQALQLAIDPKVVNERANGGKGIPATSVFDPAFPWDPGVKLPAPNPSTAKALVNQAKASGWDGKISLSCDNSAPRMATALTVQAELGAVGIDVDMSKATQPLNSTISDVLTKKDYQMACWGITVTPDEAGLVLVDGNLRSTSGTNYAGYQNPKMDAALDELKVATTDATKKAALKKVADLWVGDAIGIPLAAPVERMTWVKSVKGIRGTELSAVTFDKSWLS